MTRVFLAAGVAALAIAAPASAEQGNHGAKGGQATLTQSGGSFGAQRFAALAGKPERTARETTNTTERRAQRATKRTDRATARTERTAARTERVQTRAERTVTRPARTERVQTRATERMAATPPARTERVQSRAAERQQLRTARTEQVQTRAASREEARANRQAQAQALQAERQQVRADRQAQAQARMTARTTLRADRVAQVKALAAQPIRSRVTTTYGMRVIPVTTAQTLVGVPVATAATVTTLNPLPMTVQYLYPDTPDYYYRYGDGYLYQVDRSSNLIAALLPLFFGGYMPGSYLPSTYMSSYVPSYYGFNSFYPDYGNDCYRYGYGVIYEVDCVTGFIEDVIPLYAGGYGVGQMLPSAYSYYNVPDQYRSLYYDTPDYNYWYAPGAIYQYDPSSSLITSVAALLSPGFTVGQPLPMGYDVYNVPYAYRATYYDTPSAMYRYNNGYIYQVDPSTLLVSAIVASILT